MSLRRQLLVPIFAGGAVFGLTLHFYWLPRYQAEENALLSKQHEALVAQISETLVDPLLANDLNLIIRTLERASQIHPYWTYLALKRNDGAPIYPIIDTPRVSGSNDIRFAYNILYRGKPLGTLDVTIDASENAELLRQRMRETQVFYWVLLLLIVTSIYLLIEITVGRPLEKMTRALLSIGEGDFSVSLTRPLAAGKEFIPVFDALEQMKSSRQHAETSLQNSRDVATRALAQLERYRYAIDQHEMLVTLDALGNIVTANRRFCDFFALEPASVSGRAYQEFVTNRHGPAFVSNILSAAFTSAAWRNDVYHQYGQRDAWLNISVISFGQELESHEKYIVLATDVSARKTMETALREQKQLLESVIGNLPVVLWAVDIRAKFTLSNGSSLRDLGIQPGEAIGRSAYDIYKRYPEVIAHIERALRGESFVAEFQFSNRWYETHYTPMRDDFDNIVGATALSVDISERRESNQKLRLAARVFDDAIEGILIADHDSHIVSINRAFSEITGYSQQDIIGKTPRMLSSGRHDKLFYKLMWEAISNDGRWAGEIWNKRKNGEVYPEWLSISAVVDHNNQVSHYIGMFSDITERKRAQAEMERLAHHDALTGLPNRLLLQDRFAQALAYAGREGVKVALMFIDLDHFKKINDTLGHLIGDQLLVQVAQRLTSSVRQTDTVSRQGGDEFLVIMPRVTDTKHVASVAQKIVAQLRIPVHADGHVIDVSSSVGIAIYPEDGKDFEALLKNADTAMYQAKQNGRDGYRFFDAQWAAENLTREQAKRDESGKPEPPGNTVERPSN